MQQLKILEDARGSYLRVPLPDDIADGPATGIARYLRKLADGIERHAEDEVQQLEEWFGEDPPE